MAFLKQHRTELASKPLAVFGMVAAKNAKPAFDAAACGACGGDPRVDGGVRRRCPAEAAAVPVQRMPASDARDWAAIESFANQAAELAGSRTSTHAT